MEKKLCGTIVLEKNAQAKSRIIVNEGGTRSSKTFSLAQLFIIKALTGEDASVSIVRKTLPALRATVLKDFIEILRGLGIYSDAFFDKSNLIYRLGKCEFNFFSVDQASRVKGRKQKYLWCNEANELSYDEFQQLALRTTGQIFLDYNPSDEFHWIYDNVLTRNDCEIIRSTYLDNPFLDKETINEIKRLKETDENYWRVYGLGLRGVSGSKVYTHWQLCDELPDGEVVYGLDFGFNNPTALIKVVIYDKNIYCHEEIYKSRLTNNDLIDEMEKLGIDKTTPIYADNAEPARIEEIKRAGWNIIPANKDKKGIDLVKSSGFFITKSSVNTHKEAKSYSYKTIDGKPTDDVVKLNDHAMDAIRYAYYSHLNMPFVGFF